MRRVAVILLEYRSIDQQSQSPWSSDVANKTVEVLSLFKSSFSFYS